jgi:hypothetical protein
VTRPEKDERVRTLTRWRRAWSVAGLVFAVLMNVLLDWRVGLRAYRAALDANQAAVAL